MAKKAVRVELRACNRMHGVLTHGTLEVKRGDQLIIYDLHETLRRRRPVYTVQILPTEQNVVKDLR